MLKQSKFLTAFQQDRNPLIQLNQDNIEIAEKQRTTVYAAYLANRKRSNTTEKHSKL